MPRPVTAHLIELKVSAIAVGTELRAGITKIVCGSVTKHCEKTETETKRRRAQRRARRTTKWKSTTLTLNFFDKSDCQELGNRDTKGEPGELQSSSKNTDSIAECSLKVGDEGSGLLEGSNLLDCKINKILRIKNDALVPISSETCVGTTSSNETDKNTGQHDKQMNSFIELELPDCPFIASKAGYLVIKQSGEQRLQELIEVVQAEHRKSPIANVSDLWSIWDPLKEVGQQRNFHKMDGDIKPQKQQCLPLSEPRRIQCKFYETLRWSKHSLFEESSKIYKKMIKANGQTLLLKKNIAVPSIFDVDWSIDDLYVSRFAAEPGQQLLLPFDLVRRDDARIAQAPFKIILLSESYLRNSRRSDISLTRASMRIPTIWNMEITIARLIKLTTEKLSPTPAQQTSTATPSVPHSIRIKAKDFEPHSKSQLSLRKQIRSGDSQANQTTATSAKLMIVGEDNPLSTEYFLSDQFLQCKWSKSQREADTSDATSTRSTFVNDSERLSNHDQFIEQIARPALWDLMRKKLLQVNETSIRHALNCVNLEVLEAIIFQQCQTVKRICMNPSAYSSVEIVEACTSLRQASWLHTLRAVSISRNTNGACRKDLTHAILATILSSTKYRLLLGSSNWKDLLAFLRLIGGSPELSRFTIEVAPTLKENTTKQPPLKKQKAIQTEKETIPVRVLCSIKFLEQDELLDELCTEQQIFFIERDLLHPIDILLDESSCICVVTEDTFQVEAKTRDFIFSLARLQLQLQKCWLVITYISPPSAEIENRITSFCSALVQFRIKIQVLASFSCEETGHFVRAVIDECADNALNERRILPRLWFNRPFLLEEESQFERFLVSTKIINHYAAQSLLHRICVDDLFSRRLDDLKRLVHNAVTNEQLELLWRLVQQDHGLN